MKRSVSKKLRFEVLKRDKFQCQYCGAKAPDALLHVDHIEPVASGGSNDIVNLVSACAGCNLGKGAAPLDDNSSVEKARGQMAELEARREQLEHMLEWKKSLAGERLRERNTVAQFWIDLTYDVPSGPGLQRLASWIRKFGADEVTTAMELSVERHADPGDTDGACYVHAFAYVPNICMTRKLDREKPHMKDVFYVRAMARNRLSYCDEHKALELIENAILCGVSVDKLKAVTRGNRIWTMWEMEVTDLTENAIDNMDGRPRAVRAV